MNIVVTVKQVPDPNVDPQLDGDRLKRDGVAGVLDPGDEFGVEAGLQLAQAHGGEVTVVSMGPPQAMEAVRKALSMGAAKGILVSDDALAGADALTTAKVLAETIKKAGFDLIISGVESTDGYTGVVPQMIAALLDVPMATFAKSLEVNDNTVKINRQTEKGYDIVECPLPCVVTVTAGVNEPRYPSFKGIVEAKKKPVDQWSLGDVGLSPESSATQSVDGVNDAPTRGAGEIVEDDGTGATKIADFLSQAKVI
ncbi:MAG TPA: electron transfer flavoprotein subunit beta/FixA family protein [Actinomycetota bacterium]|jgi:electron transfer flavoprotein beta subunit|nr:electron transfer flavoprotein subunit beta/FixA family protein [Actinomycetota bacterium]